MQKYNVDYVGKCLYLTVFLLFYQKSISHEKIIQKIFRHWLISIVLK